MVSWCDPELIPKGEWDSEFAEPIMAGMLPYLPLCAGRGLFGAPQLTLQGRYSKGHPYCAAHSIAAVMSVCLLPRTLLRPAGQLPGATAAEVKRMNLQLALFHDLTSG